MGHLIAQEEDKTTITQVAGGVGMILALAGIGMLMYAEFARKKSRGHDENSGLMGASRMTTKFGSEL